MEILKGQVQWNGRNDIPCTYGKMDDGKLYYFIQELANGNIIATTALIEAIDPMTKAKNVGLIDKEGKEIIPCTNSAIKVLSEDVLLVEPAEPISQNVIEANSSRMDPLSATRLVSTPAQIKEKINAKMSTDGRYVLNDQFKDGTLDDTNGVNLVNGEYYSFVAVDKDKIFLAKNFPETDVVEFSITDKKVIEEVKEEAVTEPVQEAAPVEEVTTEPVEVVTEPVQEEAVETQPVENINEGFAKEDIDLGQEISIPTEEAQPKQLSSMFAAPVEVPAEEVASVTRGISSMFEAPAEEVVEKPLKGNVEAPVNIVGSESFDEITEDAPVAEINDNEVKAEVEKNEIVDDTNLDGESEIEKSLRELNEKFNSMNSYIGKMESKEEPVEEDTKDVEEEIEENRFTSPEVDSIEMDEPVDEIVDNEDNNENKSVLENATRLLGNAQQILSTRDEEIKSLKEENENLRRELEEEKEHSRKDYEDLKRDARNREVRDSKEISFLRTENQELEGITKKQSAKIDSLSDIVDLYKRKEEETRREMKTLYRAVKNYEAIFSSNDNYDEEDEYYNRGRRVA